jgi:hypothetical protein
MTVRPRRPSVVLTSMSDLIGSLRRFDDHAKTANAAGPYWLPYLRTFVGLIENWS